MSPSPLSHGNTLNSQLFQFQLRKSNQPKKLTIPTISYFLSIYSFIIFLQFLKSVSDLWIIGFQSDYYVYRGELAFLLQMRSFCEKEKLFVTVVTFQFGYSYLSIRLLFQMESHRAFCKEPFEWILLFLNEYCC